MSALTDYIEETPYLDQLYAELGNAEASRELGVSASFYTGMKAKGGRCRPVYEMAAELVWKRKHPDQRMTTYVVQVPSQHKDAFKMLLGGIPNVKFREWHLDA